MQKKCNKTGMNKYRTLDRRGDYICYGGAYNLWVLSMELASCHPYGA
jgi:hypothetical protein